MGEIANITAKEVSCRVLAPWFLMLRRKGISADRMVDGTMLTVEHLHDPRARITWPELCRIHDNLRPLVTAQELVEIGHSVFRSRALRFIFVLARVLFTPMGFYRWITGPKGGGTQMFACITPHFRELETDLCEIELTLPPGYEVSWEFFLITQGNFEEAPRLLGYRNATVVVERLSNGARYRIAIPKRTPFFTRLRLAVLWPFTVRSAARELRAANEELVEYQATLEHKVEERTAELSAARDELARTVEELKALQASRQRFFANVTHEIRTPMTVTQLAAQDIERRAGSALDERSKQMLGVINDSSKKLVRLVDELLLLAAGEEGKLKLQPEPTDLAVLVDRTCTAWSPAAQEAGLELKRRLPASQTAMVDPIAFERVISNLVSNAIKYTPRPGAIEVELVTGENGLRLSVFDTGPGIDEELATRLFGRFERSAGEGRRVGGTGIGLALVLELVRGHGGTVTAHRLKPHGTELRVELPATAIANVPAPTVPTAPRLELAPTIRPKISTGATFGPDKPADGTIVLAEDDAQLAERIAQLLADDYQVIVALDGRGALELIEKHQPHMLITDIDMPEIDGVELSAQFRKITGDQLAPIIVVSAVLDLGTRLKALGTGAVDYVSKPFDPLELQARVRSLFQMRELALRLHRAEQLSSLGTLVSGLAHELRNPANGIVNAVAPLRMLLPRDLIATNKGVAQLLDVIGNCAKQINTLAGQLLGFTSKSTELDLKPAKLPELVERAAQLAHAALEEIDLRSEITIDGDLWCSPHLFVQVLTNLLENAGHAAGKGGWVRVRAVSHDERVAIEVTDSGPGVRPELRDRIFEPFFTTKAPGIGTGLGLPVSRAVTQRHGGTLEVRDLDGRTAFVVDLPNSARDGIHVSQPKSA